MTPENGIVETGNSISMEIVDSFEVTELPDDEYPISEGEPTYEWFVNGADTPCKTGKQVTFTTGDANADILQVISRSKSRDQGRIRFQTRDARVGAAIHYVVVRNKEDSPSVKDAKNLNRINQGLPICKSEM